MTALAPAVRPADMQALAIGDIARPHPGHAVPSDDFLRLIPHEFARRHLLLSEGGDAASERLLMAATTSPAAVFNTGVRLGRPVIARIAEEEELAAAIDRAYSAASFTGEHEDGQALTLEIGSAPDVSLALREAEQNLLNTHGKAPAIRLVDLILFEALSRGASDVHIQPIRGRTLVRYRLDGVLHTVRELPLAVAPSVVSRIKIMARLDVAEQRAPQDGRATVTMGQVKGTAGDAQARRIDLRISTLPSTYGERVVLRLLDPARSRYQLTFAGLGMPAALESRYLAQASRSSGIVLSTGPTGSGKTTTLYTTLAWINATNAGADARGCEFNMMTIEDPVEYDLSASVTGARGGPGLAISQTQVDPRKNVTFAAGLRHILRQDPDVIMVGEIRDEETARIAVQASLTGHLVLSTLHTNDAPSAIARLLDLGVEPFLVASSLSAVLAQRLVRRMHAECAGAGCDACLTTGFRGRTAVFELLVVDDCIREMICRRCSSQEIRREARSRGMETLREAGERLIRENVTTAEEVSRVIEPGEVLP